MSPEITLLETSIGAAMQAACGERSPVRLSGELRPGAINTTTLAYQGARPLFLKLNTADRLDMFEAEADGLQALGSSDGVCVPAPLCWGSSGKHAFLVLEYLELQDRGNERALGEGLAAIHAQVSDAFGWHCDNTIGLTPQTNTPSNDWAEFWRDQRIGPQLVLANRKGHARTLNDIGARLLEGVPRLLAGHQPEPVLLHGDLWSGNKAYLPDGQPVVFDPAVYHGDRETDLAMAELFGGFGAEFFTAYRSEFPPTTGHALRKDLYQLYHVLNHLNLFGATYLEAVRKRILRLLSELG